MEPVISRPQISLPLTILVNDAIKASASRTRIPTLDTNASDDDEEHQVRRSTNSGDSSGNDDRNHKGDEASEEEESKEEDSGREEQSSDNEESTSPQSVEASDSEEGNFLYENPATEAESELIQHLLEPTREHFEGLVGIAPPTTDQERS